jgi:hypothetical protein
VTSTFLSRHADEGGGMSEGTDAEAPAPRDAVALSVVVPAYDEERRLGPSLDAVTISSTSTSHGN